jgi:excisionase family DNA binding protein
MNGSPHHHAVLGSVETHPTQKSISALGSPAAFEPLLSAVTVGHMLSLHPVTLLRWAREGRIPHHRLGKRVVFRASEIEGWLTSGYPNEVDHDA